MAEKWGHCQDQLFQLLGTINQGVELPKQTITQSLLASAYYMCLQRIFPTNV